MNEVTMDIVKLLSGHPWADTIQHFDCIDSTNTYLQQQAASGAPEGTVIFADRQTAGKGRLGRSFHSPAGSGIYMSVLLRPNCKPEQLMHLTCAVAVAVCRAIEITTGFRPQIKWVNDIVWQGKKLGGILTALCVGAAGTVDWAIVGIGINCAATAFPKELEGIATSLASVTEVPVDRYALCAELVRQLEYMNRDLQQKQCDYMAFYRQNCVVIGKNVHLIRGDEIRSATVLDVDDQGALTVRLQDGQITTINSGEVSLRGENNYV